MTVLSQFGVHICVTFWVELYVNKVYISQATWYIFSIVFIFWWNSTCSSLIVLSFQKNSLHDYEENESSHSYCTLIVRKNLTAVLQGGHN